MSANNWTICPRCMQMAVKEQNKQSEQATESYGKVSEIEYAELLDKSNKDIQLAQTLREDYEFNMEDDGDFYVSYRAHCDRCGFKYQFQHKDTATI